MITGRIWLWIDAICINQNGQDQQEKSHQVRMMDRIFSRAELTHVWLGCNDDCIKGLFEIFTSGISSSKPAEHHGHHDIIRGNGSYLALPYWYRAWIIQEIALSRDLVVRYGQHVLPWEQFHSLIDSRIGMAWRHSGYGSDEDTGGSAGDLTIKRYFNDADTIDDPALYLHRPGILARLRRGFKMGTIPTLKSLVQEHGFGTYCHDSRDHVYALLNMARLPGIALPIKIDYAKTKEETCHLL